ncbi:hypothetical protein [Nocardioides sp. cx-173]|nr:hypothetical protein [Nocardioides sp. cx-173]MCD4525951.1 hypothetical protein [Nocardioides sp. cx-173]UGB43648.1 hypothetical protein LQ940_09015 [Nocardioides sp. cx-173]
MILPGEAAITSLAAVTSRGDLVLLLGLTTVGALCGDHLNYAWDAGT